MDVPAQIALALQLMEDEEREHEELMLAAPRIAFEEINELEEGERLGMYILFLF